MPLFSSVGQAVSWQVRRWVIVGMGLLIVGLASALVFVEFYHRGVEAKLRSDYSTLVKDNANTLAENVVITGSNDRLKDTLAKQSAKIAALSAESAARQAEADAALEAAIKQTAKWRARYQDILNAPPDNPKDQCQSLDSRLNQYLDLRQQEKAK